MALIQHVPNPDGEYRVETYARSWVNGPATVGPDGNWVGIPGVALRVRNVDAQSSVLVWLDEQQVADLVQALLFATSLDDKKEIRYDG